MSGARRLLILVAGAALVGCASPGPVHLGPVVRSAGATFAVGAAEVEFTPGKGYPLGGYGGGARREEFPFYVGQGWPGRLALAAHQWYHEEGDDRLSDMLASASGTHDPLTAKALVIRPEGGQPIAWVRIDAIGTTAEIQDAVADKVASLGYPSSGVFVSATHTHAGAGAFMRAPFAAVVAMDNFRPEVEQKIVDACADAIAQAHARAAPATISFAAAHDRDVEGQNVIASNRRARRFPGEVAYDAIDDEIGLVLFRSQADGAPLALLANFAVHPTVLGPDNLYFSADLAGGIEDALEARLGAPALFVNGAEGDVRPRSLKHAGGLMRCRELGDAFAELALPALDVAPVHSALAVRAVQGRRVMGRAHTLIAAGRERFLDGNRGPQAWVFTPLTLPVNALLWTLGFTNVHVELTWNLGLGVVVELEGLVGRNETRIGGLRLVADDEDVCLLTLPGEPTHDLGLSLRELARARGATRTLVGGLTLDHVGYIASPAEYRRGGYEAWSTLFGEDTGPLLIEGSRAVLDALYPPEAE